MKDYTSTNPEFHDTIQIVDTSTPDNGDSISLADRQNFDNTMYLKKKAEDLSEKTTQLEQKTNTLEQSMSGLKFSVTEKGCLAVTYDNGTE